MSYLTTRVVAEILRELLNRDYNELNEEFYIQLTQDDRHTIVISETNEHILVKNFIPEISKAYLEYLTAILAEYPEIRGDFADDIPILAVSKSCSPDRLRGALRSIYETYAYDRPTEAFRLLGGFVVRFLDMKFQVISDVKKVGRLFSDAYISLPDENGWFQSNVGLNNIYLPILSWKANGSVLTYVPDSDGSLRVFNVTEFLGKIQKLFESVRISFRVNSEVELFQRLHEVEGSIELAKTIIQGGAIPFIPPTLESKPELVNILKDIEADLRQLKKAIILSEFIERRVILRGVVKLASKVLKGESGVLSASVRKVSKLGAGYAIYISKEEAKVLKLTDSVVVKVVAEEGQKPKIVIQ